MPDPSLPPSAEPITDFHIGEEFGTARRNLPPAGILAICLAAVAIIVAILVYTNRAQPQGSGQVDLVTAVDVPGQNLALVAITMTLRNTTDKPLWIHTLKAHLTASDGQAFDDEAASAVDLDRYFQAFPALKDGAEPPLAPEMKLPPGASQRGTIIVSFKGTKDWVGQRKNLSVSIQPYDQMLPVVLK